MIGLLNLGIYKFIFNRTEENNKLKPYQGYNDRFPYHSIKHNETEWSLIRVETEVPYENVKDEIAKVLSVSDISVEDSQDETIGPLIINE